MTAPGCGLQHIPRKDMQKDFQNDIWVQLVESARELGIKIDDIHAAMLLQHLALLAKWNRIHNLTAITDPKEMVIQHIPRQLGPWPAYQGSSHPRYRYRRRLSRPAPCYYEHGPSTGPCWIVAANVLKFVRHIVSRLGLGNVSLANCRIENYRPEENLIRLQPGLFLHYRTWCY